MESKICIQFASETSASVSLGPPNACKLFVLYKSRAGERGDGVMIVIIHRKHKAAPLMHKDLIGINMLRSLEDLRLSSAVRTSKLQTAAFIPRTKKKKNRGPEAMTSHLIRSFSLVPDSRSQTGTNGNA